MTLSTFALVLAVIEFLFGFPLLLFPKKTGRLLLDLTKADLLYRTIGALFLVLCVLVLAQGMSVGTDVPGLIRLVAWVGAIKCLIICWWPEKHALLAERMLSSAVFAQRIFAVIALAAGVFFSLASTTLR